MKTKIFWGNQYVDSVTVDGGKKKIGKFRSCVNETKRIAKFTLLVMAAISLGGWVIYGITYHNTIPLVDAQVIDRSKSVFENKIDALKLGVVNEIKSCEGLGHKESDGLIVFDTNSKASLGLLQFQVPTIIFYEKSLYGKTVTAKEAVAIALDDTQSSSLAKDVMFNTKNMAGKDWVNCAARFNSDQKIRMIKSLEK